MSPLRQLKFHYRSFVRHHAEDDHHQDHDHHHQDHHYRDHHHDEEPHKHEEEEERPKPKPAASIFGQARPVDTTAREKEIEERLRKKSEERQPEPENGTRYFIF